MKTNTVMKKNEKYMVKPLNDSEQPYQAKH